MAKQQWISADAWRDPNTGVIYVKSVTYSMGTDRAGETQKFSGTLPTLSRPGTLPTLEDVAALLAEDGYEIERQHDKLNNFVGVSFTRITPESPLEAYEMERKAKQEAQARKDAEFQAALDRVMNDGADQPEDSPEKKEQIKAKLSQDMSGKIRF